MNARSHERPSLTARDIAAVLFRQKTLLMSSFGAVFVAAILYGAFCSRYEAHMKILLRHSRVDPVMEAVPSQAEFQAQPVTDEEVNSEMELLQDEDVLRAAVERSGLARLGKPWFGNEVRGNDEQQLARAVRVVGKRMKVEPARKAALIVATYDSSVPEEGAQLLQALGDAYLERHTQVRRPSGALSFFDEQKNASHQALENAELALVKYGRDQGVVSAGQERDLLLQRLSEAEADLGEAQVAAAQNSQRIKALDADLASLPERAITQVRSSQNPELLEKLKSRLLELQLQRTELLTQYEPSYRLVQQVDEEIKQASAAVKAEEQAPMQEQTSDLDSTHEWVRVELVKAEVEAVGLHSRMQARASVIQRYRARAHELGNKAVVQEQLLNELKGAEQKYLLYVNKREEARIGDALDRGGFLNVAIVEQPITPMIPKHSLLSIAMLGFMFASVCSVSCAFAADYLDPSVRTPDEISTLVAAPVLASLPAIGRETTEASNRRAAR